MIPVGIHGGKVLVKGFLSFLFLSGSVALIFPNRGGAEPLRLVEVIDDFERPGHWWWGSGKDAHIEVKSATKVNQIGDYAMEINYAIYSFNPEKNWITLRRVLGPMDFSQSDGLSLWVKGSGGGGDLRVILEDANKNKLQYVNTIVLGVSQWMKIYIPFNHLVTEAFIEPRYLGRRATKKMDFSRITAIEFQIALPNRGAALTRGILLKGTCYIDQLELVPRLIGFGKPVFAYIPDGYSLTEYYTDAEFGGGMYKTINIADSIDYKNVSLNAKIAIPSRLVLGGREPSRVIDWMRADDARVYNEPGMAISIKELYLSIRDPIRHLDSIRMGSLWLHWSPFTVFGQSKYAGTLLRGGIGRIAKYETFLAVDYWRRKHFWGTRLPTAIGGNSYFTPILIVGQQKGKYESRTETVSNYRVLGVDFQSRGERISIFRNVMLSLTYLDFLETQYGIWRKERPWDARRSYWENLRESQKGGIIMARRHPEPLKISDGVILAKMGVDSVGRYPLGLRVEGRYIGRDIGAMRGYQEAMLPWMRQDSPCLLKVERRNETSIVQNRYRRIAGIGYGDQKGMNFKAIYGGGSKLEILLERDLSWWVSDPDIQETRIEGGVSLTRGRFEVIGCKGKEIAQYVDLRLEEISYYELGLKCLVFSNLELVGGYRNEKRMSLISPENEEGLREIVYAGIAYGILPNVNLNFRMKIANPQFDELPTTAIGDTRDGDFREWSDHMPDDYTQLVLRVDF